MSAHAPHRAAPAAAASAPAPFARPLPSPAALRAGISLRQPAAPAFASVLLSGRCGLGPCQPLPGTGPALLYTSTPSPLLHLFIKAVSMPYMIGLPSVCWPPVQSPVD